MPIQPTRWEFGARQSALDPMIEIEQLPWIAVETPGQDIVFDRLKKRRTVEPLEWAWLAPQRNQRTLMDETDRYMRDQPMPSHLHFARLFEIFSEALRAPAHDWRLKNFGRETMPPKHPCSLADQVRRPSSDVRWELLSMLGEDCDSVIRILENCRERRALVRAKRCGIHPEVGSATGYPGCNGLS